MESITIREVQPEDLNEVARVNELAFNSDVEGQLVKLLHARGKAIISLAAMSEGRIVGHILFSPVSFSPPQPGIRALGLAPLAVLPEYQNQGIGTLLSHEGLRLCRSGGWQVVVVLGHPDYYPRFGFQPASVFGLGNEYGADEAFMAIELQPGILDCLAAVACYCSEFKEIGA